MTGASGTIGSEVANRLIANGANVVCLCQDKNKVKVRGVQTVVLNLREPYQIEKKFSEALELLGGDLDILILCHGVIIHHPIITTNNLEWDNLLNLNVRPCVHLTSLAMPFLKKKMEKDASKISSKQKEKENAKAKLNENSTEEEYNHYERLVRECDNLCKQNIVILSSAAGIVPQPGATIYSVGAAMLNSLVQCTALEVAYYGIRVNAVAPSVVDSASRQKPDAMNREFNNNQFLQEANNTTPLLQEIPDPGDVANSICWLASNEASFVTGEILVIDGGHTLTTNRYQGQMEKVFQSSDKGWGLFGGGRK
mmetsp:Transcript_38495/g.28332  ORF Transcript_38495/g.28332 Transcript_38495/m.28332 type:complete len:311 (+) Transcript_38495:300-1232(+)